MVAHNLGIEAENSINGSIRSDYSNTTGGDFVPVKVTPIENSKRGQPSPSQVSRVVEIRLNSGQIIGIKNNKR